ncbi:SDR family NAD(P)-dependent oxidoreductase [Vibrio sp. SCSIO 43136]|uniref:SDR family NAD(P)-dependent oxidoreductase n=1 Tax=Vibrio sp. SCSIO 43136 TaxID=2819101 RepID=UPI002074BC04|nr:SDR family NAD(P)-dependent oxidoreductase [Vibrio sp. SCSIO 43136]USD67927.1 SDR family NAD(P)-dependent oxidoreductase [Vibrio sp. SCSIO 43136]
MKKRILITGATDGIGLETAKILVSQGHSVIVHGRNLAKLQQVEKALFELDANNPVETIVADLSKFSDIKQMVAEISERFGKLDVLVNNAGIFATSQPLTEQNLDVRFVVNTLAPYFLTKELLPLLTGNARVVNLSSAAQASVDLSALGGAKSLSDGEAYAQSKLALTMWSAALGEQNKDTGPMIVSVNPKSFLGSKMVKEAYGVAGNDLSLGADILVRASLSEEFADAHGKYFDNDIERFANAHSDTYDKGKVSALIDKLDLIINQYS